MTKSNRRIAVLTSGGDAQGMNAALRAIIRTAIARGAEVFAIYEGYQGMVAGGDFIRRMDWKSVGGVIQKGGTMIGTARSEEFKSRTGRLQAAFNLLEHEIDSLVVIGGDGSLTGANIFRQEWPSLLQELVDTGKISAEVAERRKFLTIVGLVGSIDNDMYGTDMTIGADSALHRITDAIDAIASTASSHQRSFVVKVMGRNCGYLALMGGLASGADWVLIPESPPDIDNWEEVMSNRLMEGRKAGRRDSIVVLAEGARDRHGNPIGSTYVQEVLEKAMGEEVRVTVLGHVQRGGAPSGFDRNLGTLMGYAAVETLLACNPEDEPKMIALRGNRIVTQPLIYCVEQTLAVAQAIAEKNFEKAMELRSPSFREAFWTLRTFGRVFPNPPKGDRERCRIAILNSGAPSPGMNTATRAAVRLVLDKGHIPFGVQNGFEGLIENDLQELNWHSVNGWASMGGAELGTNRVLPSGRDLYAIARTLENQQIKALFIIGGWSGYEAAYKLYSERNNYPAFDIPIIILPASISNNLPGSELSVGADTALNNIIGVVDKIKQSAVASRRVFVVEVMGYYSGYLALMSGMATGAERVYIHEEGVSLKDLQYDVERLNKGFQEGRRLGLMIRNENANRVYTTQFMVSLFEAEGGDLYDVRQSILGHMQQGGDPSPFDRIMATRLANKCVDYLEEKLRTGSTESAFIGQSGGKLEFHPLENFPRMVDEAYERPKHQWWMDLRPIARLLAQTESPQVENSS